MESISFRSSYCDKLSCSLMNKLSVYLFFPGERNRQKKRKHLQYRSGVSTSWLNPILAGRFSECWMPLSTDASCHCIPWRSLKWQTRSTTQRMKTFGQYCVSVILIDKSCLMSYQPSFQQWSCTLEWRFRRNRCRLFHFWDRPWIRIWYRHREAHAPSSPNEFQIHPESRHRVCNLPLKLF